jgi:hypothetical protein
MEKTIPFSTNQNQISLKCCLVISGHYMCFAFTLAARRGQSLSIHIINDTTKEPRTLLRTPTHVMDMNFDFESAFQVAYDEIMLESKKSSCRPGDDKPDDIIDCYTRKRVDLNTFPFKTRGGLSNTDRQLLSETYFNADSVFEFGIGESTAIAAETNLPRYAGVDSSAEWITVARSHAPDRFRFSFAMSDRLENGDSQSATRRSRKWHWITRLRHSLWREIHLMYTLLMEGGE